MSLVLIKSNIFLTCDLNACKKDVLSPQLEVDDYSSQKDFTDTLGLFALIFNIFKLNCSCP